MSHTPGPWEAWNSHGGVTLQRWRVGERNASPGVLRPVAIVTNEEGGRSGDEQVANARLIAACPDLLAALEAVIVYAETEARQLHECKDCDAAEAEAERADAAVNAAYLAIAKARGE